MPCSTMHRYTCGIPRGLREVVLVLLECNSKVEFYMFVHIAEGLLPDLGNRYYLGSSGLPRANVEYHCCYGPDRATVSCFPPLRLRSVSSLLRGLDELGGRLTLR